MHLNPKDVALNALAGLGPVRAFLRRVRDRNRPIDYDRIVDYSLHRLEVRREFIGDDRIRGATLLEIGSGPEVCVALLLLAIGARRLVNIEIDPYRFLTDGELYRRLVDRAREKGIDISWPPAGIQVEDGGGAIRPDPDRISLFLGRSAATIPEPDQSADVTFSVAVLEHVGRSAMRSVADELYRVTKPGGVGYHRIDLVDHYYRREDPFRFLRMSSLEYRLMYGNRGSSSNRYRLDDFERIFRDAGFSEVGFEDVRDHDDDDRYTRSLAGFHEEFRNRDPEMLRALECMLVIKR